MYIHQQSLFIYFYHALYHQIENNTIFSSPKSRKNFHVCLKKFYHNNFQSMYLNMNFINRTYKVYSLIVHHPFFPVLLCHHICLHIFRFVLTKLPQIYHNNMYDRIFLYNLFLHLHHSYSHPGIFLHTNVFFTMVFNYYAYNLQYLFF